MSVLANVVWSEGMYLSPRHFQRQGRYFEDSIHFALSSLWFAAYGFTGLELGSEALRNGTAALVHATGVLPDGLPFNIPEVDAPPEHRSIAGAFPPERDATTLLLAIPRRTQRGPNCTLENTSSRGNCATRYQAEARVLADENTGGDGRPVAIGRKNVRLLLDTEPADQLVTLPVARIVRDASGHFAYDPSYVAPVLQVNASPGLMSLVQRLIEILEEKVSSVTQSHGAGITDVSPADVADFWLLHGINSALAPLRHLICVKRGHPEDLFVELLRLAGALHTFSLNSDPRQLPLYDHYDLGSCFQKLDRHIREDLEIIVPTNCLSIPLKAAGNYFYEAEIADQRCVGRSQWVLAIRAGITEVELMVRTPQLIKICSPPFVRELVKRALPGLALKHLPVPPPPLRPNLEKQYFSISRTGPCWEHIAQIRRVGVYIPGDIPDPEAELLVILDRI